MFGNIPIFAAMLRIGFDAKRAFRNYTGLGNYSRSVIRSLSACFPDNEYLLYTPKLVVNERTQDLLQASNIQVRQPRIPILTSAWRSRFVVPQLLHDRLDIYHGLSHEIPVGIQRTAIKTVVTIHDLIFLRYPQYYKAADRRIYEIKFRNACKHADAIVAVSEQTKRDIIHFFGTPAERIQVIYQSCDNSFRQPADKAILQQVKDQYDLPDRYLLSVGTIEERKNLMLIVRALRQVSGIPLLVIGKETAYAAQVKAYLQEHGLADRVRFLRDVSFEALPAIYRQATVFIYPSEFEGFGIPILEALYSDVPVIAATGSCLEEAGGPGSIYVAPDDDTGLAAAINRLLNDAQLRIDMIQAGQQFAAGFTEKIQAGQLMQLYRDLVKG